MNKYDKTTINLRTVELIFLPESKQANLDVCCHHYTFYENEAHIFRVVNDRLEEVEVHTGVMAVREKI